MVKTDNYHDLAASWLPVKVFSVKFKFSSFSQKKISSILFQYMYNIWIIVDKNAMLGHSWY